MEEILRHLGCMKPCRNGIFSISTGAGFLPSTVCYHDTWLITMKFDWMDHVGDPAQQWSSCQRSRKGSETGTARIYSFFFSVWALPRPWLGLNTCFWWDVLLRWRSIFFSNVESWFLTTFLKQEKMEGTPSSKLRMKFKGNIPKVSCLVKEMTCDQLIVTFSYNKRQLGNVHLGFCWKVIFWIFYFLPY